MIDILPSAAFLVLLEAFEAGYNGDTWASDWSRGLYRWAYQMGRRQRHKGVRP